MVMARGKAMGEGASAAEAVSVMTTALPMGILAVSWYAKSTTALALALAPAPAPAREGMLTVH